MSSPPPPPPHSVDVIPAGWSEPFLHDGTWHIWGALEPCPFATLYANSKDPVLRAWGQRHRVPYTGHIYDYYTEAGEYCTGAISSVKQAVVCWVLRWIRRETRKHASAFRENRTVWEDFLLLASNRFITFYAPGEHPTIKTGVLGGLPLWTHVYKTVSGHTDNKDMELSGRLLLAFMDMLLLRQEAFTGGDFMSLDAADVQSTYKLPWAPANCAARLSGSYSGVVDPNSEYAQRTMYPAEFIARVTETVIDLNYEYETGKLQCAQMAFFDRMDQLPECGETKTAVAMTTT